MDVLSDPLSLPRFSALGPEAIGPAMERALADYRAAVARVLSEGSTTFEDAWMPLERANNFVEALWSAVSHLKGVADTPELRAAHAAAQAQLVETNTAVMQNRELFDLLNALAASPEFARLSSADRAAVEGLIRDFTLSGVALDPAARSRFAEISLELSRLGTEFGSAVMDATDAWSEHVADEAVLAGVPAAAKSMFAQTARARGLEHGWVITLQMPSVNAVLTFAEDRCLRERVYTAFGTRASDQGAHARQWDNSERIARILELRGQAANLLGFADPVEQSLAKKMATSADEVLEFLRDLAKCARPHAERELAEVRAFAVEHLGIAELEPWDVSFASDRLRLQRYAVDEEEVRAYFPVERVLEGWRVLLNRLFGVRLIPRDDVEVWHEDARYFDVAEADGEVFSGLYLDLHARPGKQGGAWMAPARSRLRDGNVRNDPVAYLTCNFAPPGGDTPALLSHADVVTLLHETGHCLHHLFTRVDRPRVAGILGFEWDAIELPSQLMEDFAWDAAVLADMSGHYLTGQPLPAAMFEKMMAARQFQSGLFIVRQLEFALFDILLHLGGAGADPMEVLEAVRDEVAVIRPPKWHRFPHAFSHIFAGGYAAGYYSYLWAEVLAADAFGKFTESGGVDRPTGDALRNEILARGATRPAAESFRAFRGREVDASAILVRRGLADPVGAK